MQIALLIREKNSRTEKVDFETPSVRCVCGHHACVRAGLIFGTRTVVADGQFDSGRNLQKTPSCERSHPFRQFGTVWCIVSTSWTKGVGCWLPQIQLSRQMAAHALTSSSFLSPPHHAGTTAAAAEIININKNTHHL
jgi:hypothetical protein